MDADNESVDDVRSDFDAAIDKLEAATEDTPDTGEETLPEDDTLFSEPEPEPEAKAEPEGEPEAKAEPEGEPEAKAEPETKAKDEPPMGFNAAAREAWKDVPPDVKKAIATREKEVTKAMEGRATERRTAQAFSQVMTPFSQPLQQLGYSDPFSAVQQVLGAAIQMQSGTPQQRAAATAKVIRDFGIDITELDNALVSAPQAAPQQQAQQPPDVQALVDQRLNEYRQQEVQGRAQQEVTTFSQNAEFIADVRIDMADILDLAAKRGQQMTMQEAYDKACQLHPDVSKVLAQRAAQQNAGNMQQKRRASSSVVGSPTGVDAPKLDTIEDTIRDAFKSHGI